MPALQRQEIVWLVADRDDSNTSHRSASSAWARSATAVGADLLRLENLDVDIAPDAAAIERTRRAASEDADNSYLPFVGQTQTCVTPRRATCRAPPASPTAASATSSSAAGGLSGILNVLLGDDRSRRRGDRHRPDLCRADQPRAAGRRRAALRAVSLPSRRGMAARSRCAAPRDRREDARDAADVAVDAERRLPRRAGLAGRRRAVRRARPDADRRQRDGAAAVRRRHGACIRRAFPAWPSARSASARRPRSCA